MPSRISHMEICVTVPLLVPHHGAPLSLRMESGNPYLSKIWLIAVGWRFLFDCHRLPAPVQSESDHPAPLADGIGRGAAEMSLEIHLPQRIRCRVLEALPGQALLRLCRIHTASASEDLCDGAGRGEGPFP